MFGRIIVEAGTRELDSDALARRIGATTSGIASVPWASAGRNRAGAARLIVRGKARPGQLQALVDLLEAMLLDPRIDDRATVVRLVREAVARHQARLTAAGHDLVDLRMRAPLDPAGAVADQLDGLRQRAFLRRLAERVETEWDGVRHDLDSLKARLVGRRRLVVGLAAADPTAPAVADPVEALLGRLAAGEAATAPTAPPPNGSEGFVVPGAVCFVGKVADLRGMRAPLSIAAPLRLIATGWLWDRVRVAGGAYGALCRRDPADVVTFLSFRDPHILSTLDAFDGAGRFLRRHASKDAIHRSLIGAIAESNRPMHPKTAALVALQRALTGQNDAVRLREHEAILDVGPGDFAAAADALDAALAAGAVAVLGPEPALTAALTFRPGLFAHASAD